MARDDDFETRPLIGRGLPHAKLSQAQAKGIHPRQILPAVALGHGPDYERLGVHELDVEREPRRALDQHLLHAVGTTTDMARQLISRCGEKLALARPPVEASEKLMLPAVRAQAAPNPFLWRIQRGRRHAAMLAQNEQRRKPLLAFTCVMLCEI